MALKTRSSEEDESAKLLFSQQNQNSATAQATLTHKTQKEARKRTQQGTTYLTVGSWWSDGQKWKKAKRQDRTVGSLRIDPCQWMVVESDGLPKHFCSRSLNGLMESQPFDIPQRWRSDRWISATSEQQLEPSTAGVSL
jgi:hypothetical protein